MTPCTGWLGYIPKHWVIRDLGIATSHADNNCETLSFINYVIKMFPFVTDGFPATIQFMFLTASQLAAINGSDGLGNRRLEFVCVCVCVCVYMYIYIYIYIYVYICWAHCL